MLLDFRLLLHSLRRRCRRKSRSAATVRDQSYDNKRKNNDNDVNLSLLAPSTLYLRTSSHRNVRAVQRHREARGEPRGTPNFLLSRSNTFFYSLK